MVFFLALLWCFFGVALISDTFMESIEVITSGEKTIVQVDEKTGEKTEVTVSYWNATVANLTLLALGSSAPEILLALIETAMSLGKEPGELGPSTIVGSASFNLLAITGICMLTLEKGETRRISELPVFLWTAFASVAAYAWVYIVYKIWTPDLVTIPEAFLTLAFFPLLVGVAYVLDVMPSSPPRVASSEEDEVALDDITRSNQLKMKLAQASIRQITVQSSADGEGAGRFANRTQIASLLKELDVSSEEEAMDIAMQIALERDREERQKWSRMKYRINAVRSIAGKTFASSGHRESKSKTPELRPSMSINSKTNYVERRNTQFEHGLGKRSILRKFEDKTTVYFAFKSKAFSVLENAGHAKVGVRRGGDTDSPAVVEYLTRDGAAKAGSDYEETKGLLEFKPGQEMAMIEIPIIDDDEYEPDEEFYVELANPVPSTAKILTPELEILIIDDDEPGVVAFSRDTTQVLETDGFAKIEVVRKGGSDGEVTVYFQTLEGTAEAGEDYEETSGTLTFESGELSKYIEVPIIDDAIPEQDKFFRIRISNPTGGATLGRRRVSHVCIVDDDKVDRVAMKLASVMKSRIEKFGLINSSWLDQFKDAMMPEGGVDEFGEQEEPDGLTCALHYVSITWKVLFAFVPPAEVYGGWTVFWISILFIAGLTAIIAEFASAFGCVIGLKDQITAISFVALGTSLPDTFASVQATRQAPDADAAIGNVTGSNAVNVFLGLGLPWVLATLYYAAQKDKYPEGYVVDAGSLGFSVLVFTVFALFCITALLVRRSDRFAGAELGGKGAAPLAYFLFFLWFMYIVLSALQAYDYIKVDF